MTTAQSRPGMIYFCPVCGAELAVIGGKVGDFHPRCCNRDMVPKKQSGIIYTCPVCGTQVMVVRHGAGVFVPRCCNHDMFARPVETAA